MKRVFIGVLVLAIALLAGIGTECAISRMAVSDGCEHGRTDGNNPGAHEPDGESGNHTSNSDPGDRPGSDESERRDLEIARRICSSEVRAPAGEGQRVVDTPTGYGESYWKATISAIQTSIERTGVEIEGVSVVENLKLYADTIIARYQGVIEYCVIENYWKNPGDDLKRVQLRVVVNPNGLRDIARQIASTRVVVKLDEGIDYPENRADCSDGGTTPRSEVVAAAIKEALIKEGYEVLDDNYLAYVCSADLSDKTKGFCDRYKELYKKAGTGKSYGPDLRWGLLSDVLITGRIRAYVAQRVRYAGEELLSFRARGALRTINTSTGSLIASIPVTPDGYRCCEQGGEDDVDCKALTFRGRSCYQPGIEVLRLWSCKLSKDIVQKINERYAGITKQWAAVKIYGIGGVEDCGRAESEFSKLMLGLADNLRMNVCTPDYVTLEMEYSRPFEAVVAPLSRRYTVRKATRYYIELFRR